jgi:hypothetical protein
VSKPARKIAEAIEDLRRREKTGTQYIGSIAIDGHHQCHDEGSYQAILSWTLRKRLAGVVWTDLRTNFAKCRREPFSIDAAMRYLKSLEGESLMKAAEYFQNAPSFAQTPLRDAFKREALAQSKI